MRHYKAVGEFSILQADEVSELQKIEERRLFSAKRYPEDIRNKAVEAVNQRRLINPRDRTIYREVAEEFDIGEQSLRLWVKKQGDPSEKSVPALNDENDDDIGLKDNYDAMAESELEGELKRLRSKIEKLEAENQLLKKAFVVFSSDWSK